MAFVIGAIIFSGSGSAFSQSTTISILGDSLVAGYGLSPDAGLVPKLQDWLNARNAGVVLINAGVSGDTTYGGLSRLEWTLTQDVNALVVSLGANDMLRGLPPTQAMANLGQILSKTKERGLPVLLMGFQAPSNWGPDYKSEFDAVYPTLADEFDTLLLPSFTAPLMIPGTARVNMDFLQQDGLHPNPEGVAKLVEVIGPYLVTLSQRVK